MKNNQIRSPHQQRRAETALYEAVLELRDVKECRNFFADLCTPAELQALVDRWSVVEPLANGEPYRAIHDKTGVSVTTIGRVARFLTDGNGGYELVLERVNRARSEA